VKKYGEENSESVKIDTNLQISINLLAWISSLFMVRECDGKHGEILENCCSEET
jgi:hypothetical protein